MCNAWNHPSHCTCGWGGIGHSGTNTNSIRNIPQITASYESYINPNARCPVCGEVVFFYQSPSGGKVFFDELGPPWPKHRCTNHLSSPKEIDATFLENIKKGNPRVYNWQKNDWSPIILDSVKPIDKNYLKLCGTVDNKKITLYIKRIVDHHLQNPISTNTIIQVKRLSSIKYELSLISINNKILNINAFLSLSDARKYSYTDIVREERHFKKSTRKKIVRKQSPQNDTKILKKKRVLKRKKIKIHTKEPINNIMEIVLKEAMKQQ